MPYDAELECKQLVIIYDSNTRNLKEDGKKGSSVNCLIENDNMIFLLFQEIIIGKFRGLPLINLEAQGCN